VRVKGYTVERLSGRESDGIFEFLVCFGPGMGIVSTTQLRCAYIFRARVAARAAAKTATRTSGQDWKAYELLERPA